MILGNDGVCASTRSGGVPELSGYFVIIRVVRAVLRGFKWRYRLGVRTEDSQSSNPGSIPGSATKYLLFSISSRRRD